MTSSISLKKKRTKFQFNSNQLIPVLAIVGVGLIGGSIAAALRQKGQVGKILGIGRKEKSLKRFQLSGLIDDITTIETAAKKADVIILATPIGSFENLFKEILPHLRENSILTDVGSTKVHVMEIAARVLGEKVKYFVPGHPIAGNECSGADFSNPDLFKGRRVILTPFENNTIEAVELVHSIWQICGANVSEMTANEHDQILASVSHVPHFLSAAYMAQIAQTLNMSDRLSLAGSGFRDFTRIAAGSPKVWRDIFLSNRKLIEKELHAIKMVLNQAENALHSEDGQVLETLLENASKARKNWP